MRAGGHTLTLLGAPRTFLILQSLAEGTKGRLELRRSAGSPAETTLRGHLKVLEQTGVMVKQRRDSFPGALEYDLADQGRRLLEVAAGLDQWLSSAPNDPLELGGDPAKAAIKGLVDGWNTGVLSALATSPLSLTELDKQISTISYPAIERCLETMRLAELLDIGCRSSRGTPYAVTDWLRRGLHPLALAARWEFHNKPECAAPLCGADVADAIALITPLLSLPSHPSGICQMAVRIPDGEKQNRFLGSVEVKDGAIAFGPVYPQRKPDAWVAGAIDSWFAAVIDAETKGLRLSGNRDLAHTVLDCIRQALFEDEAELLETADQTQAQG